MHLYAHVKDGGEWRVEHKVVGSIGEALDHIEGFQLVGGMFVFESPLTEEEKKQLGLHYRKDNRE